MKKFLGTMSLTFLILLVAGQNKNTLRGKVTDKLNHQPIAGAIVSVDGSQTTTNDNGSFSISWVGNAQLLTIKSLGYRNRELNLSDFSRTDAVIELEPGSLFLQPLEVRSIRAADKAPFAKTNIGKEEIVKTNLGQDIPFLLNQTPSVVINSDAGNGVGYTGIRIRGTDATRINVTLNGIPYNDAESMGTFFVNLPDFSSSVNSIQVQRGVGTSSNGAAAFGATINLSTNEFNDKAYTEFNNSFGSFNTRKHTLKAGTGLLGKHFTVDARVSSIQSDGYIDRASSNLKSFYVSGAWLNQKSSLRLNVFSGKEKTYQAWYGVPQALLETDRTNNPAGTEKAGSPYDNQTDNYTQTHYQLFFNHAFNSFWSLQTAAFLTRGYGYYEEYKANQRFASYGLPNPVVNGSTVTRTDLVRQRWLNNYFYGQNMSLQYRKQGNEFTLGGGWSTYVGDHYGTLPWLQTGTAPSGYRYYNNPALKKDANLFAKWQQTILKNLFGFVDLQYRHVRHTMRGFQNNPLLLVDRNFNFFNPKIGITYRNNNWQAFVSYAIGHKEPNRDDFEAGIISQPKAEKLKDLEAGIDYRQSNLQIGANFYYMNYINQLVLTGQINDVGAYTRFNVPKSYRLGVELQATWKPAIWLSVGGNLTISKNKIKSFTEYTDNYDSGNQDAVQRKNTDIAFSPATVAGTQLMFYPAKQFELGVLGKYVGRQYMDNSQLNRSKLNAFATQDVRISYSFAHKVFKQIQLIAQVNNLFNKLYEPNGYSYSYTSGGVLYTDNGYYPMAGRNFMVAVNLRF
ncbi:TonB-dependent receptor [Sediminibacterium goheungense]|uniref:Iron complex outermembrane receptor protein n=1 Tax=Sediminibacterium goheungense TaxID=1086393 RepID=A0A4R6IZM2_9BACT|nr:TonB-dependent receptor plug domain-containing protein [Sediminibacterium goheungense]TDO28352.1 iron complex outermembrane receptor protein [Sediminibacterium goheungense]